MKKLLTSAGALVAVSAMLAGGTYAYFTDSETSQANTFSAGTMNLTINGQDGSAVTPAFTISNVVPGQTGTPVTIALANTGNTNGNTLTMTIPSSATYSGTCTEPEVNDTVGLPTTDLDDDCDAVSATNSETAAGTNELDENVTVTVVDPSGPTTLFSGTLASLVTSGTTSLGGLNAGQTRNLTVNWTVATGVGNEIQDDGVSFPLQFTLTQN